MSKLPVATPHPDIWFSDGNIVVIAGQTAFKVHQGQLGRHSDIFKDLFLVPQPPEQHLFHECPWVELYDTPSDVFHLLSALYDGLYIDNPVPDDFTKVAAVLRLSTKYLIGHLRQRCLQRLELDWPSSLASWDHRERIATETTGRYSPRDFYPHPLLIVDLARELSLPGLLPAAYYDLSRYGPRRIVSGTPTPFPILRQTPDPSESERTGTDSSSEEATLLVLQHDDLKLVFLGREAGQRYISKFIDEELVSRPLSADCLNRHLDAGRVCRESSYYVMLNILRAVGGISHGRDADPLFTLTQVVDMLSRTDFTDGVRQCGLRMCASCKSDLTNCADKARREVWDLVPGWFNLQAWKEPDTVEGAETKT